MIKFDLLLGVFEIIQTLVFCILLVTGWAVPHREQVLMTLGLSVGICAIVLLELEVIE